MHTKNNRGFSLIELMIVVAIIAILAATTIPSYQTYLRKARFADIITAVQPYKIAIALALQEGYALQDLTAGKYGIPLEPKSTANFDSIKIEKGIISAYASSLLDHITYILKPESDGSAWHISGTCLKYNLCSH